MDRIEVEVRAHRIIDDVLAGRPVEDDATELKAAWPTDFRRAARRVAGHANAAAQQPIFWLIGVDEEGRRISGAGAVDPAAWYPQLQAQFAAGWAPGLLHTVNVPRDEGVVVALVFDTIGAPFQVRADPDLLEVPWREGTRVRSARRHELLATIANVVRLPQIDIVDAYMTAQTNRVTPPDRVVGHTFAATFDIYVTLAAEQAVHFPFYRSSILFRADGIAEPFELGPVRAMVVGDEDISVRVGERQVSVTAPAFIRVYASRQLPLLARPDVPAVVQCRLGVAGNPRLIEFASNLVPTESLDPNFKRWNRSPDAA